MMSQYEETRNLFKSKNQLNRFESGLKDACGVIMRQTDYNEEKALEKLKEHDLNVVSVVHEYLGVKSIEKKDDRTTNQKVFGEFRRFLDEASSTYYKKQEAENQRQEYNYRIEAAKKIIDQKNNVLQKTQLDKIQENEQDEENEQDIKDNVNKHDSYKE
jgi:anion-transporting  ArsA/GET3 family ATPase